MKSINKLMVLTPLLSAVLFNPLSYAGSQSYEELIEELQKVSADTAKKVATASAETARRVEQAADISHI